MSAETTARAWAPRDEEDFRMLSGAIRKDIRDALELAEKQLREFKPGSLVTGLDCADIVQKLKECYR